MDDDRYQYVRYGYLSGLQAVCQTVASELADTWDAEPFLAVVTRRSGADSVAFSLVRAPYPRPADPHDTWQEALATFVTELRLGQHGWWLDALRDAADGDDFAGLVVSVEAWTASPPPGATEAEIDQARRLFDEAGVLPQDHPWGYEARYTTLIDTTGVFITILSPRGTRPNDGWEGWCLDPEADPGDHDVSDVPCALQGANLLDILTSYTMTAELRGNR